MPGPIEPLPCPESYLKQLDPRWKLASMLLAIVAVLCLRAWPTALAAMLIAVWCAFLGRLPFRWCVSRLGVVLLVLLPFLILLPFVHRDDGPAWTWGALQFSVTGVLAAVVLALKTLAVVLLVLVLLATSPLPTTFKAAQSLHMPGLLVRLADMTYRYIFVLAGELARLRIALRVRGFRNRPGWHTYRTVGHVAGTLLVRGYEQAERVEQAMRCRGFDGSYRTLNEFRTRPMDVLAFSILFSGFVGLVIVDRLIGA